MRTRMQTVAWLLVLLSMVPGLAFGQRLRLTGRVVDPSGKPIEGVQVTATSKDVPTFRETRTTDRRGSFTIDLPRNEVTYQYHFVKPGYCHLRRGAALDARGQPEVRLDDAAGRVAGRGRGRACDRVGTRRRRLQRGRRRPEDEGPADGRSVVQPGGRRGSNLVSAWVALAQVQVQAGHNKEAAESAEKAIALGSKDEAMMTAGGRRTRT